MGKSSGSRTSSGSIQPVRILLVDPDCSFCVRFLGGYRGILTHWPRKTPIACPGASECVPAVHRARTLWRAYAAVEQWLVDRQHWQPAVLQITEHLEEQLRGRRLRGETWIISRPTRGRGGNPVIGDYIETTEPAELRPEFDYVPVVCRFYHCSAIAWDVPNPTPAPVRLEPAAGAPPNLPAEFLPSPAETNSGEAREEVAAKWKELRKKASRAAGQAEPDLAEQEEKAFKKNGQAGH